MFHCLWRRYQFMLFGYAVEILCTNIESVKVWIKVEYIGIPFLSLFWLIMVINFTGYRKYLKRKILILLFVIPIMTLILNYTNDVHHLFYKDMYMNYDGIFPIVEIAGGPWYFIETGYEYSLIHFKAPFIVKSLLLFFYWNIVE